MRLTRRFLLVALTLGAGLSTTTSWPGGAAWRLRRLLGDGDSARQIGALYRRACPAEADARTLTRLVLSSLALDETHLPAQSEASLRARVAACVRSDFIMAHTVTIDGWILSRTEARLCALWS